MQSNNTTSPEVTGDFFRYYGKDLMDSGYRITPILPRSKRAFVPGWQNNVITEADLAKYPGHGLGILCCQGEHPVVGVDIDTKNPKLVQRFVDWCLEHLGDTCQRVGNAPKVLLPYRAAEAGWSKKVSLSYVEPAEEAERQKWLDAHPEHKSHENDRKWADAHPEAAPYLSPKLYKLELLGQGQQFVAYGIHPDTGKPYQWTDTLGLPQGIEAMPAAADLPSITQEQVRAAIAEFERLAPECGLELWKGNPSATGTAIKPKDRPPRKESDWFGRVNDAAMANLSSWVPVLFPEARPYHGGYRVSSEALGRDLEEDLSIVPDGGKDFGVADMGDERGGKRSPIDLVMEWGPQFLPFDDPLDAPTTPKDAAFWLCQQMEIEPEALGYGLEERKHLSVIYDALERLTDNEGALYEPGPLEALRALNGSDPAEYARVRARAKDSKKVVMGTFDRLTTPAKGEGDDGGESDLFPAVEPWPDHVDGAELLDEITETLGRFVVADRSTLQAAALWVVFTWFTDVVRVSPIANITAPQRRCGKTVLLSTMGRLAYRPLQGSSISPSALYRSIDKWQPSLLIDEVDAFLKASDEARGILNSGHTRSSAYVIRCVGDDFEPKRFSTWGAKALCGIGAIADTLADRSIPLRLQRKLSGEDREPYDDSKAEPWESLRTLVARFALDNRGSVANARRVRIKGLNDRANDCMEPLLAIAEAAGRHWPETAVKVALAIFGAEEETPSIDVELLADIKAIFDARQADSIFSADLLILLNADQEAPWGSWNHGKEMRQRQLTKKLEAFGIHSKPIRIGDSAGKTGYKRSAFVDAWTRYLPPAGPVTPSQNSTSQQARNGAGYSQFQNSTVDLSVEFQKPL